MDDGCEFDDGVAAEDGIVWVVDVHYIEGYSFGSLSVALSECHVELHLADGLYFLATEANKRLF